MFVKLCKKYLPKYKLQVFMVLLFALLQVLCQLILPQMTDRILRQGVANSDMSFILRTSLKMFGMTILVGISTIAGGYFSAYVTAGVLSDCRRDIFYNAVYFSGNDFDRFSISSILNRTTSDMTVVQMLLINGLRSALLIPFTGIGALIVAFSMNTELTVVVLVSFVCTAAFLVICGRISQPRFKKLNKCLDKSNGLVREKILGARSIRAFGRQTSEDDIISEANESIYDTAIWANRSVNFMSPVMQLIMNLVIVAVYYLCAGRIQLGNMDSAAIIKFMQYILNFIASLTSIVNIINAMPNAEASSERILEIIEFAPTIVDPEGPEEPLKRDGKIEFKNVSFKYPGSEKNVLSDISLTMEPGTTTAIIGTTGSGKSTLLSAILRFIDITEGRLLIDGVEIKNWNLNSLHKIIAYAPQKALVLNDTVYNNLKMADPGLNREEALRALSRAEILDFIEETGQGLDFVLEQQGRNVSGGQRQRICLARMFARNDAEIFLMDDTFSALDMKTDSRIRGNINKYLKGKTKVFVAQRIATILDADQIVVLKDGVVCGIGRHEALLESCSEYREMCVTQQIIKEEA